MDQETKDYLDQKLMGLAKREDVEKLRQEAKANSRQLKEENRTQLLEGIEEIKANLEKSLIEERQVADSLRAELQEKLGKWSDETKPLLDRWNQDLVSSLSRIREEMQAIFAHSKLEMGRHFELIQEEEAKQRTQSKEDWKVEIDRIEKGREEIRDQMKRITDEALSLHEKIKEGFLEIKDEVGSMIRFSFADLEKKIQTLEARIKALEKMIFH